MRNNCKQIGKQMINTSSVELDEQVDKVKEITQQINRKKNRIRQKFSK